MSSFLTFLTSACLMITNKMKFCFHILLIFSIPFLSSCAEDDEDLQNETDGYKMVLFGHNFFLDHMLKNLMKLH